MEHHQEIVSKIEDEVSNAYIEQEINRCKWEENKTKEKSAVFHEATRRWIQGRQKLYVLRTQLSEDLVRKAVSKNIFPDPKVSSSFLEHVEGKSPLEELRILHQKAHDLREILQAEVDLQLSKI